MSLLFGSMAYAGNKKRREISRLSTLGITAHHQRYAPPKSAFSDIDQRTQYLYWLGEMSERLKKKLPDSQVRIEFLEIACHEAKRSGLDPSTVLGLIQVESVFRKYAMWSISVHGYMQVMPYQR